MRRVTWANVRGHPLRTVSTALSVVLGVAFVTGTFMFTDTVRAAFDELFGATVEGDVVVRASDETRSTAFAPVPVEVVEQVAEVDGVATAEARYRGFAKLATDDGEPLGGFGALLQGVDAPADPQRAGLTAGTLPQADDEVAIDAASATTLGKQVGDQATLLLNGPEQTFTIAGIVEPPEGVQELAGSTTIVFNDATAERLYGADGATYVSVFADTDVEASALRNVLDAQLDEPYQALTVDDLIADSVSQVGDFLGFLTQGLLVFAGAALLVGGIIIFNTFGITIAQRTRELALVQAVGADSGQVLRAVLLEAVLIGLVGSVLGVLAGVATAVGLRRLLAMIDLPLPTTALALTPRIALIGVAIGVSVTLLAAIGPALRAARRAPVDALRDATTGHPSPVPTLRITAGALLGGIAASTLIGTAVDRGGMVGLAVGAVSLTVGLILLSPVLAGPVAGIIGTPVRALRAVPGLLARANAVRNPSRTAATAMALLVGLAMVTFMLILVSSFRTSLEQVIVERFRGDFQIQALDQLGYPTTVTEAAAQVDGVGVISPAKVVRAGVDGSERILFAVEPATLDAVLGIDLLDGELTGMADGGVVVAPAVAAGVGDTVEVAVAGDVQNRQVVGVMDDLHLPGTTRVGQVLLASDAVAGLAAQPDLVAFVKLADGADRAATRSALEEAIASQPDTRLADTAQLREQVGEQTNRLLGLVLGLVLLSVVIAFVGVVNILGLSVSERSTELGLLQALGMTPQQTREMVRWESVIITALGTVVGVTLGTVFGWLGVRVLRDEGLQVFSMPIGQVVLAVAVMLVAGVVASVLPARRASTIDVVHAVTVE